MNRLLALACLLLTAIGGLQPALATPPMVFRHLDTEAGLPQNTAMAVLQDSQGFIWIGTEDGLGRYDGYGVVRYGRDRDAPDGLASSFVWDIEEDARGDLWVATKDGGLARWSRQSDRFQTFRHDPSDPGSLSSDSVRHLLIDSQGTLWIGTTGGGLNSMNPETGSIRRFRHDPGRDDSLASDVITALHEDAEGQLWVGTAAGLHRLLRESGTFRRYVSGVSRARGLSSDKISAITSDRDGAMWVGTFDGGLNRFDRELDAFTSFRADPDDPGALASNEVRAILADSAGRLWIGTQSGLHLLTGRDRFTRYRHEATDPSSLADDYVMSLFEDRNGLIWVGTRAGGVSRWNPRSWLFGHRRPAWLERAYVVSFADDSAGRLWVGTLGAGLHRFDAESGRHQTFEQVVGREDALPDKRVMSLLADRAGRLWIGTLRGGLGRLGADGRLDWLRAGAGNPRSLSADGVTDIMEARDGRIWISTFGGGVNIVDPEGLSVQRIEYDAREPGTLSAPRATALAQDSEGFVWVGTESGGLNLLDEQGRVLAVFRHGPRERSGLSADTVYSLHVDDGGRVWVGTDGGGLDLVVGSGRDPGLIRFRNVSKSDGLASDIVYGVQSDASGRLWISGNAGLTRYDPQSGQTASFHREHGLQGEEFTFGAHFRTRSGKLAFGGAGGFNLFDPVGLMGPAAPPRLALTRIEVMNRPASLDRPYPVLEHLALGHRDDVVSFEFAALDYAAPAKNRYAYRLRGFDEDWIDLGSHRRISYTNLDAGDYVLEVRAANPDGVWSQTPLALPVTVAAPPWLTGWAKLLYAVAAALALFLAWRAQRVRLMHVQLARARLEQEVAQRTLELRERNEELDRVSRTKSEFLSRMSHEIRTPMNGVIGMTELLLRTDLTRRQSQLAATIDSSARALLQILNEVLDLARVESGKLRLEAVPFDLREVIEVSVSTFAAQADAKGLELTVGGPVQPGCGVVGDPTRLRQVLQNLVGNAIKFTPGGEITVLADLSPLGVDRWQAQITVQDTGIGMSRDTLDRVFEPFAQADESTTRQFGGTGLGLAICRQLAELMDGTLEVSSEPGIGSTFTLRVPLARPSGAAAPAATPLAGVRGRLMCRRPGLSRVVERQLLAWGVELDPPATREAPPPSGVVVTIVDADSEDPTPAQLASSRRGDSRQAVVWLARASTASGRQLEERFGAEAVVIKPIRHAELLDALARAAGLRAEEPGSGPPARGRASLPRLAGHVLVVEDNPVNAAVAEGMLDSLGCRASVVSGGQNAVARALAERFDLILMDLHMPDLDGLAATALIRRGEQGRRTPIIALTADAADANREACLSAGMDDFLAKPFRLEDLRRHLSQWLPAAAAVRPAAAALQERAGRLDAAALARIRALDRPTGPRLLQKVASLYEASSTEQVQKLLRAVTDGRLDDARALAHALKSGSANVGAADMAQLCQRLESACSDADAARARDLVERLAETHPGVLEALRDEALRDSA